MPPPAPARLPKARASGASTRLSIAIAHRRLRSRCARDCPRSSSAWRSKCCQRLPASMTTRSLVRDAESDTTTSIDTARRAFERHGAPNRTFVWRRRCHDGAAMTSALRVSLEERLRELRGDGGPLPGELLDAEVQRIDLGGPEPAIVARPSDWEALREAEALARRGVPYWAVLWPSGLELARAVSRGPGLEGRRVLELGCGLGLPSVAAAARGATVLATDAHTDAVVFAAHNLALNGLTGDVAVASFSDAVSALADGGPWDLVLAADVLYLQANVEALLRALPRVVDDGGEAGIPDPEPNGARDFLAAARKSFTLRSERGEEVSLHRLRRAGQ